MSERKFKIGVMGGAEGEHPQEVLEKAAAVGKAIAEAGELLLFGATIGIPLEAAKAAKEAGGFVLGISPALNEKEHIEKYKLPIEGSSTIVYSGFGFAGRNVILVRSCDAVIIIDGRVGTLIEFGTAYAEERVIGALTGTGGVADKTKELEEMFAGKNDTTIIYESDPAKLVGKVIEELGKQKH